MGSNSPFFVILNTQNGGVAPLVTGDDGEELALFDTEAEASRAGMNNPLGSHFGYEIFERGAGS